MNVCARETNATQALYIIVRLLSTVDINYFFFAFHEKFTNSSILFRVLLNFFPLGKMPK